MKIDVITLFPEMVEQALSYSIPARAQKGGLVELKAHQLRDWAIDSRGTVDDSPYGGGPGMILRVDVAHEALEEVDPGHQALRVMLTPDGERLNQNLVKELSNQTGLVLLCGRYEGFDARIEEYVDRKISIGDYVLSGGEIPALTIIDAVIRLVPGVLGNADSLKNETFEDGVTDFAQFTRPESYQDKSVPTVLLSGHHAEIDSWRKSQQKSTDQPEER